MLKDIFYVESEKRIFWVAGYQDNSYNANSIIDMLENCLSKLRKYLSIDKKKIIFTEYISKSSRYKSMRVFWIDEIECPTNVEIFKLGNDWTMQKWIEN